MFPPSLTRRYDPVRKLGAGGMGVVYLARDRELKRQVAVKLVLRPDDGEAVARFRQEARAMASIEHPNVARLLDFGEAGEQLYLVLEFVSGASPSAEHPDPLPPMLEIAAALEAVHAQGVLHRDLKPSNLVQREDGALVLIDFGLARHLDETGLTATGEVVGTPYFIAPEILLGEPPSTASDFYAWGATLYMLLEGVPPIPSEAIQGWALHGDYELTWERTPAGSEERRLARHCLAHDPRRRPTTVDQLEAIRSSGTVRPDAPTQELPVPPPAPPAPPTPAPEVPGERQSWWALAATLALGLACGVVYSLGPTGVLAPEAGATPAASAAPAPTSPEAEAVDRTSADLARLFLWESPGEERDPSWVRGPTARAVLPVLADVRLAPKLRRAAAATTAWVRAVEAEGPDAWRAPGRGARMRRAVVGGLLHAIALHRVSRNLLETNALRVLHTGSLDPALEATQVSMPELRAAVDETVNGLVAAATGEARLVFEAFAAGTREETPRDDLVPDLLAALRADPPSPLRDSLAIALDYLVLHVVGVTRIPCDQRSQAVDLRSDVFRASPAGFSHRDRWRRRLRAMTLEVQLDRACDPPNAKRRESHFRAYLGEIEARGATVPDLVGTALEDVSGAIFGTHVLHEKASPWLRALAPRLRDLRRRFPPPPGESAPDS